MVTLTCKICGKKFQVPPNRSKTARYCSRQCYDAYLASIKANRPVLVCEECGKEFSVKPGKADQRKYCSEACYLVALRRNPQGWSGVTSICQQCGKEFRVKPYTIKKGGGKFCSRTCYAEHKKSASLGENNNNWKAAVVERQCIQCGKTFTVFRGQLQSGARVFCSRKCMGKYKETSVLGENNPNWKGGPVPYPRGWRKRLREQIRDYADRRCELCGKTEKQNGRRLCVHHIDYDKNNLAIENLVALCTVCHARTNGRRDYWEYWFSAGIVPEMMEANYGA